MNERKGHTILLRASDVETIIREVGLDTVMDALIEKMDTTFRNYSKDKTDIPVRSGFNYTQPHTGLVEWMPLYQKGEEVVIKVVGYHPENPEKHNLPTVLSTISAYDAATGHLKIISEGVLLTSLRTGAASAVASRIFAHPNSRILGIIGCGAQSVTQLHALSRIFDFKQVLYYDVDDATTESFEERVSVLGLDVEFFASDIETIGRESDILCTCTSVDVGEGPLFDHIFRKPFLHINAVGSDFPGKIELPLSLLKESFVCPDFLEQAIKEGECEQLAPDEIGDDIFTCIQNEESYKHLKNLLTVFDSTGTPLEDAVVLNLFWEYATQMGLGQEVVLESIPKDVKNPYEFVGKGILVKQTKG